MSKISLYPHGMESPIREISRLHKISQEALAIELGVSGTMVNHYSTGRYILPLDKARYLYRKYDVVIYPYSKKALKFIPEGEISYE